MSTRERRPLLFDGLITVALSPLVWLIFRGFGVAPSGVLDEFGLALAAFIAALLIVSQVTSLLVGSLVSKVHSIGAAARGVARPTVLQFVNRHLDRLDDQIKAMLSSEGALLDVEEVTFWTELSFQLGTGTVYDGTDSHVPSTFNRLYPTYLEAHGNMLQGAADNHGSRVLIGNPDDFRDDFINRYEAGYSTFLEWHDTHEVPLLHVSRERAQTLRRQAHDKTRDEPTPGRVARLLQPRADRLQAATPLPTLDMGVWHGRYALLFRDESSLRANASGGNGSGTQRSRVRLWWVFPGSPWYRECVWILNKLRGTVDEQAVAAPLADAVPEIFERDLCLNWESFVRPDRRLATLSPFLNEILGPYSGESVLDAAAGIGCDALSLIEQGWNITLNEIEPVYRELITRRFLGRKLRLFAQDWRTLPEQFDPWFGAVLVLGNSLCLLLRKEEQARALDGLFRALKPGGMLVIDERNFAHFSDLGEHDELMRNPVRNFPYSGRVIYCGEEVKGYPKRIKPGEITFSYYKSDFAFERHLKSVDELDAATLQQLDDREIGVLHFYPFKTGELAELLITAGFTDINVFADVDTASKKPYSRSGNGWYSEKADFITYTAVKPLNT